MDLNSRVQAKSPVDCCGKVGRGYRIDDRVRSKLVTGTKNSSAADASACQGDTVTVRPVVPPRILVDLGGPAELAKGDHQGRIEQSSFIQVLDQRGQAEALEARESRGHVRVVQVAYLEIPIAVQTAEIEVGAMQQLLFAGVGESGTKREEVERGQVLAKPGSITPHTKFKCEAYILTKEEGGRHTPFFANYRPQFYFRTTDVTGTIELPEGTEMVMPGDNVAMTIQLIAPIAMDDGLRFAIREGGRTVGAGVVAEVIE